MKYSKRVKFGLPFIAEVFGLSFSSSEEMEVFVSVSSEVVGRYRKPDMIRFSFKRKAIKTQLDYKPPSFFFELFVFTKHLTEASKTDSKEFDNLRCDLWMACDTASGCSESLPKIYQKEQIKQEKKIKVKSSLNNENEKQILTGRLSDRLRFIVRNRATITKTVSLLNMENIF
jgi:hypothetical protein